MQPGYENPYQKCPVYETQHFIVRLVQEADAQDLLECYSDANSAKFFNSDNCLNNFVYHTLDAVRNTIRFWLDEYQRGYYVRFSILDKASKRAVGTLECFAKQETFQDFGRVGLLRIDLASKYETQAVIIEILLLVTNHFYDCFNVQHIITKAIPEAEQRIAALKKSHYQEIENGTIVPYDHYYGRGRD